MGKNIHTDEVTRFFEAVLTLKTVDECYAFFEDVCTINELLSISQRLEVAHMLTEHKTYLDIAEKTGASTYDQPCQPFVSVREGRVQHSIFQNERQKVTVNIEQGSAKEPCFFISSLSFLSSRPSSLPCPPLQAASDPEDRQ